MTMLIAVVLTVGLLASCIGAPITNVQNAPPPRPPEPLVETAPAPSADYRVTVELFEDTALTEDGAELARYAFELPSLAAYREDGTLIEEARTAAEEQVLTSVAAFNGQFSTWLEAEDFQFLTQAAREEQAAAVQGGYPWAGPYELALTCSVYQTEHLISVSAQYYSYTGGAHPNTCLLGWNFDLLSGAFFQPEALAEDGPLFSQAVQQEIVRQAGVVAEENDVEPEALYWTDYQEIAAGWSSYAVSFDEAGMTVGFSPYEMACYAAGSQVFTLPYALLLPYLGPQGRAILDLEPST